MIIINIYDIVSIGSLLKANAYPGRGIIIGMTPDAKKAAVAYFIMGRSENSRNRIFTQTEDGIRTEAFDPSKVSDSSLIIYNPVRRLDHQLIVTNGDQTDTIYDHIKGGKTFEQALETRCFEPDHPNCTPRISGLVTLGDKDFTYKMSILKSADEGGSACMRFTYSYPALPGLGHFLHTYAHDGVPLPSFQGEPRRVSIPDGINTFAELLWDNLDPNNKISLYVNYICLGTGKSISRIINKNK